MATTVSSKIPFKDLCNLCENICNKRRDKKVECLKKYMDYFREFAAQLQELNPEADGSFFPVMRLLLPQLDRDRGAYGVKENTLAKIYIRILCLPKEGQDASKLLNFKAPRTAGNIAGDFADVAFWVLKNRCLQGSNLNVEQVNSHLENIAMKHAAHDPRGVDAELTTMLGTMSATEQKWLIRMLLKDMKLGVGQSKIFSTFHLDARELYDVSNNLLKVCHLLRDPSIRLHEVEVEVFSPFRPMLAERCDVRNVEKSMKEGTYFFVETKHDGERFQIHMDNKTFRYFSRNGFEYTNTFGSTVTPKLSRLLRQDVKSLILDGEMMGWNSRLSCYKTKGNNFDVKSLKVGDVLQPCFCVFDILLYNGKVLTNQSLLERLAYLDGLFTPEKGVLAYTERVKVRSGDEVMEQLNLAIDLRLEGIVLKDPATIYKPNTRKGGWYKIKPEYTEGLMDHLDVIIMGGYFGEGRRKGYISHFLVGAAVPPETEGQDPKEFHSLGRVGSGYSMEELAELLQKLTPHWQNLRPGETPPGLAWTKEKPDVWIAPSKSYILQIKATEITYSNAFKMTYTLRFPRVQTIRYDKKWTECITTVEFESLRMEASGKLYSRHVNADDPDLSPKKKKQRPMGRAAATLGERFRAAELSGVDQVSGLLQGKELCIVSGWQELTKQQVETTVVQHGGSVVQNPGSETFCILAGEMTLRVRNVAKGGKYDVVRIDWLLRALAQESTTLLPWTPADLMSICPSTAKKLELLFDRFGDSFTSPATNESLQHALSEVQKKDQIVPLSEKDMADMDIEIFSGPSPYAIFRLCNAYFEQSVQANIPKADQASQQDVTQVDFRFYGGCVSQQINELTTHVILHSSSEAGLKELQNINRERCLKFYIVTAMWVEESVCAGHRKEELDYPC